MVNWVIGVLRRTAVLDWLRLSHDSEDGFRTGCRNVSRKQQSFSGPISITQVIFFNQGSFFRKKDFHIFVRGLRVDPGDEFESHPAPITHHPFQ